MSKLDFGKIDKKTAAVGLIAIALILVASFASGQVTMNGGSYGPTGAGLQGKDSYSYLVTLIGSTYYVRNGSTGVVDYSSAVSLTACQWANDHSGGGLIILHGFQKPAGLSIGSTVVFQVQYQDTLKVYTNGSSGKVGNSPVCTNGTFTLQNNVNEQFLLSLSPSVVTELYNFYFDVSALTKDATVRVYSKVDGSNWRLMTDMTKTVESTDNGLVLQGLWANTAFNITIQSTELEGATRSIPYRYFSETW